MAELDWMEIRITVPGDEGSRLLPKLREQLGVTQIDEDWCTEKRKEDNATVVYAPCPEPPNRKDDW